jgi:hypothetical protein
VDPARGLLKLCKMRGLEDVHPQEIVIDYVLIIGREFDLVCDRSQMKGEGFRVIPDRVLPRIPLCRRLVLLFVVLEYDIGVHVPKKFGVNVELRLNHPDM